MRIRLALVLAGCALLGTLALAATASAAASDGAQVIRVPRQCETTQFGTFCFESHMVVNVAITPWGGGAGVVTSRFDASFVATPTGGACSSAQSGQEQFHGVTRPDGSFESFDLARAEFRFGPDCTGGVIIVCETVNHFQVVNGVIVFQRSTAACTEEPAP